MVNVDTATANAPVRGIDLRLLRLTARVSAAAVAREAGWSRQRVSAIEASDIPTSRTRRRYLDALARATAER